MSSISSGTLLNTGLTVTSDTSGNLVVKTGTTGNTAAVFDANGSVNFGYSVNLSSSPTLNAGTTNGVAYLNGSKVLTTGSALVFDGTNVGIGTSSPASIGGTLSTVANGNTGVGYFRNLATSGISADQFQVAVAQSTSLSSFYLSRFYSNVSSSPLVMHSVRGDGEGYFAGNVGIGITPGTKLDVYTSSTTSTVIRARNDTTTVYLDSNNGYSYLNTYTNHPMLFGTNNIERMRLDSGNGYLLVGPGAAVDARITVFGAGTTSTSYTNGDATGATIYLRDSGGSSGNGGQILFGSTFGVHAGIKGLVTNGTGPAGELIFQTRTTSGNVIERVRVDSSGKFMVGTSGAIGSATGTFVAANDVAGIYVGTSTPQGLYVSANSTSRFVTFAASGAFGGGYIFNVGNTEAVRISLAGGMSVGTTADPGAGAIYSTGNITSYYSDKRLKTIFGKIENALDKVDALSGVYYTNNDIAKSYGYTSDEVQVGVLAQDVESVFPEIVKAAPFDLDDNGNSKSGENYKTVQYERIVPLLIEAIKELRAEIKLLKGE